MANILYSELLSQRPASIFHPMEMLCLGGHWVSGGQRWVGGGGGEVTKRIHNSAKARLGEGTGLTEGTRIHISTHS